MVDNSPRRNPKPVSFAAWPEDDREAWTRAIRPADIFSDDTGHAAHWKASTRDLVQVAYGNWLRYLEVFDPPALSLPTINRVNLERVTAYWKLLEADGLAPNTVATRLAHLGDALHAMWPAGNWQWIRRGGYRLQSKARPIRDKQVRLRPAEDVLQLGFDLMNAATNDRFRTALDRATLYRDGLLIALFTLAPLRRANMTDIAIGKQLVKRGKTWWLTFGAAETKGKKHSELAFPTSLVAALECYIATHRPVLLKHCAVPANEMDGLWISKRGTKMTACAIAVEVGFRTKEEFGVAINPHSFRDLAATTIASDTPKLVTDVMAVLGHSSLRTSQRHYIHADTLKATERLQSTIDKRLKDIEDQLPLL